MNADRDPSSSARPFRNNVNARVCSFLESSVRRLESSMLHDAISMLASERKGAIDDLHQKHHAQGKALLEHGQRLAAEDLERGLGELRAWEKRIRSFVTSPCGEDRLPGLLPPQREPPLGPGMFEPEIWFPVSSCFQINVAVLREFDGLEAEGQFQPETAGNASATQVDPGLASLRFQIGAAEGEATHGEFTARLHATFSTDELGASSGAPFERTTFTFEPLGGAFLIGSIAGDGDFSVGGGGSGGSGGGNPIPAPMVSLRLSFEVSIQELRKGSAPITLAHTEVVYFEGVVEPSALIAERPFAAPPGTVAGVIVRAGSRSGHTWRLNVGIKIVADAQGPVQLTLSNASSRLSLQPAVVSREKCSTKLVNFWDLVELERTKLRQG
jgi:hypothetical protein